jgi:hypothetical protein
MRILPAGTKTAHMGFLFDGNLISPSNTAQELEMEEDDEIDTMPLGVNSGTRSSSARVPRAGRKIWALRMHPR